MIEEQPNDDAAVHHNALVAKGHEEQGRQTSSKLEIADCTGVGVDPTHPHLFHLAATSASVYDGGNCRVPSLTIGRCSRASRRLCIWVGSSPAAYASRIGIQAVGS